MVGIRVHGGGRVLEKTAEDGTRSFSLDRGATFVSEDAFQAEASRVLSGDDALWTPQRLADFAKAYALWVMANYNVYGDFGSAFHKDDAQPTQSLDAQIMNAYGEGAERAMGFIRPVSRGVAVFTFVMFTGGTGSYLITGASLGEAIALGGPSIVRAALPFVDWGIAQKIDWKSLTKHERTLMRDTLKNASTLARYCAGHAPNTPMAVRKRVLEIMEDTAL